MHNNIIKNIINTKNSFGFSVMMIFFSFAMILTFIFSLINLNRRESKQRQELEENLDKIYSNFVSSLTGSLWSLNESQIDSILKSILSNNHIEEVKIIQNGQITHSLGRPVVKKYLVERKYPLIKSLSRGEPNAFIGDLYVGATTKSIEKKIMDDVRYSLITEFIKILFFVIITSFFMRLILTRHLTTITNFFYESNIYKSQKKLQLSRANEFWKNSDDDLDKLVIAINQMIDRLHFELQKRRSSEEELKNLNENLEVMVERRTKQLLDSNRVEAVIEMASGIAHEINSPLSVIYALAKRYKKMSGVISTTQNEDFADKIEVATKRIFSITNALHVLSVDADDAKEEQTNFREFIDNTIVSMSEIFRSTLPKISYVVDERVPQHLLLNQSLFYQSLYSLLHLRHKEISKLKQAWIQMEFSFDNDELIWSCIDEGRSLTLEEQEMYKDPFKSRKEGQRGSNLILGTFSTLIHKLNAKIIFVPHNKNIFIQLRIPFKEKTL